MHNGEARTTSYMTAGGVMLPTMRQSTTNLIGHKRSSQMATEISSVTTVHKDCAKQGAMYGSHKLSIR